MSRKMTRKPPHPGEIIKEEYRLMEYLRRFLKFIPTQLRLYKIAVLIC